jgi:hypothetical protein
MFRTLIRVGALAVVWSLLLCNSLAGYLQMYWYSPFVVCTVKGGEPRSLYIGLYTVGGYNEGYFFPT